MNYKGMTVNERLVASGELKRFDRAIERNDIETLKSIIRIVELDDSYLDTIVEHYGLNKSGNKKESPNLTVKQILRSTSNLIFIINTLLIGLAIVADKLWEKLGLDDSHHIYFFLLGVIIFGLSFGAFFVGIKERKTKKNFVYLGLIGNLILVLLFLILFFYIALTM